MKQRKPRNHCGYGVFLELLTRFELVTSSLPILFNLIYHAVACCIMTLEPVVLQQVCGFICCHLSYLVVIDCMGF